MVRHRETLAEDRMHFMKKGFSFAKSLQLVLRYWDGENEADGRAEQHSGFGYLKRMVYWREQGHPMKAVTVKRYGIPDILVNGASGYAGASAIRRMIEHDAAGRRITFRSRFMQSLLQLTFRLPWRRRCSGFCGMN